MEADIHELDVDLQAKTASLKLAHTRLENRNCRPGVDLCRDEVRGWLWDQYQPGPLAQHLRSSAGVSFLSCR